jgi:hypothetical protein
MFKRDRYFFSRRAAEKRKAAESSALRQVSRKLPFVVLFLKTEKNPRFAGF